MGAFASGLLVVIGAAVLQTSHAADARQELQRLFADERSFAWREDPLATTNDGMHDYDDRLPKALRQRAEAGLGARFDLREFHDAVLGQGGVTLPVLRRQVDACLARARSP